MSNETRAAAPAAATDVFANLLDFLRRLAAAQIPYTLRHSRDDAIMVEVTVPGERWEIDFLDDGDIDVEIFRSRGDVSAAGTLLEDLIRTYGEPPAAE